MVRGQYTRCCLRWQDFFCICAVFFCVEVWICIVRLLRLAYNGRMDQPSTVDNDAPCFWDVIIFYSILMPLGLCLPVLLGVIRGKEDLGGVLLAMLSWSLASLVLFVLPSALVYRFARRRQGRARVTLLSGLGGLLVMELVCALFCAAYAFCGSHGEPLHALLAVLLPCLYVAGVYAVCGLIYVLILRWMRKNHLVR